MTEVIEERAGHLPSLAYLADVPVEASYHGSALIYRLLQNYPRADLVVVEGNLLRSDPLRRLESVRYESFDIGSGRLYNTRLHTLVSSLYAIRTSKRWPSLAAVLGDFRPQAILTVAHGYSWLAAAELARHQGLPLHLVVHDDWPSVATIAGPMRSWLHRRFRDAYRQARSRFCVSPNMEATYRERYGVSGTVLYPSRAANAPRFVDPPTRAGDDVDRPLVFGFGGTINTQGHVKALRSLAAAIRAHGARLNLYGPFSEDVVRRQDLLLGNVSVRGLVKADEFIGRMRDEVDVLVLPMSFEQQDRENMRLCFPSKLTDYTAAGIPILIVGEKGSSAVQWAQANPGTAEVVESHEAQAQGAAIARLQSSPYRRSLATTASQVGEACFSHASIERIFFGALSG
jgi:glycosyltransferase involved in cell wall biosynthesis